ncbi:YcjX family protein [Tistrella mobilis]|uniref:YcjX family protein n=1 Tax=Tistrella mobilis TaxID=171437 RepID=UPI0031F69F56
MSASPFDRLGLEARRLARRLTPEALAEEAASLLDRPLRLGVTGLARSGKTVFTTAVARALLFPDRLPFLQARADGRLIGAELRRPGDPEIPRFAYETHLARLAGSDGEMPGWPASTRMLSQLRMGLRWKPAGMVNRRIRPVRELTLDIIDYPGEWLLDLALIERSFADWSAEALAMLRQGKRAELARPFLARLETLDPAAPADDVTLAELGQGWSAHLIACRAAGLAVSRLGPGRFLVPGDLEGAPVLAFSPLPEPKGRAPSGSLYAVAAERFDQYRKRIVGRFFREHFARLDRQVVLVDLPGALSAGADAVEDLKLALTESLGAFRYGRGHGMIGRLLSGVRIDRVLFAATKADQVPAAQHARLDALMQSLVADAARAIRFEGAETRTLAIAAVKAAESVFAEHDGRNLACVRGRIAGRERPSVVYPGELPADPAEALARAAGGGFDFPPFLPPEGLVRNGHGMAHIRLDQALDHLIGDRLG